MMDPRNILLESRLNAIHASLDELGSIAEANLNVLLDRLTTSAQAA